MESLEINAVYDPLGVATLKYGPVISDKINTEALAEGFEKLRAKYPEILPAESVEALKKDIQER